MKNFTQQIESCNKQAEQNWFMNLIIASACTSWFVHSKLIVVFHCQLYACCKTADSVARCTLFCISKSAWFSISNGTISAWPCWLANISGDKSLWMKVSWMQAPHTATLTIKIEWWHIYMYTQTLLGCSLLKRIWYRKGYVYDMNNACSHGMQGNGVNS